MHTIHTLKNSIEWIALASLTTRQRIRKKVRPFAAILWQTAVAWLLKL